MGLGYDNNLKIVASVLVWRAKNRRLKLIVLMTLFGGLEQTPKCPQELPLSDTSPSVIACIVMFLQQSVEAVISLLE